MSYVQSYFIYKSTIVDNETGKYYNATIELQICFMFTVHNRYFMEEKKKIKLNFLHKITE